MSRGPNRLASPGSECLRQVRARPAWTVACEIEPAAHAVQDAGGEGIAGADPVDDPGDDELLGLRRAVAGVDPRREPMGIRIVDMARGRGDQPKPRKGLEGGLGRLAPPRLTLAGKVAAEQQGDVAMIAEQDVGLLDQLGQNRSRVIVPARPELRPVIAVEGDPDALAFARLPRRRARPRRRTARARA